ncbi:MAG: cytochrome b [Pseudomonadota bacterium]
MSDTKEQFSKITLVLHWLIAITIIAMMIVGTYMQDNKVYDMYPTHKSIGMLIFLVILVRVVWRLKNGWPTPIGTQNSIEHMLAKSVHWVLLIGTVLFPISGMIMSGTGGHGLAIFGLELLASNYDATGKAIALNAQAAENANTLHGILPKVIGAAVILHIMGALKHHFVDKDGTLRRMLGNRI